MLYIYMQPIVRRSRDFRDKTWPTWSGQTDRLYWCYQNLKSDKGSVWPFLCLNYKFTRYRRRLHLTCLRQPAHWTVVFQPTMECLCQYFESSVSCVCFGFSNFPAIRPGWEFSGWLSRRVSENSGCFCFSFWSALSSFPVRYTSQVWLSILISRYS